MYYKDIEQLLTFFCGFIKCQYEPMEVFPVLLNVLLCSTAGTCSNEFSIYTENVFLLTGAQQGGFDDEMGFN